MKKGINFIPEASPRKSLVGGAELSYVVPSPNAKEWEKYWDSLDEKGDVFFPYWLETWNSAFALYEYFRESKFEFLKDEILEVAGGSGVLSQLLASKINHNYFFSDFVPEAVIFASRSVNSPYWKPFVLDVQNTSINKKFNIIIASDCLYQSDLAPMFCDFFAKHLTPQGKAIVADPNRMGVQAQKDLEKAWVGKIKVLEYPLKVDGHHRDYQIFELSL